MKFPETLAERQVAEILEQEGLVEQPFPAPAYHPRSAWREQLRIFGKGVMLGVLPVAAGLAALWGFHEMAPNYYRVENVWNIGAVTVSGVIGGTLLANILRRR